MTPEGTPEFWAEEAIRLLRPVFDPKAPTALFVGRYQPFHEGHKALIVEGIKRVGQVCIAVRDTQGVDTKNPFAFEYVRARIEHGLREFEGRFVVVPLPNISHIFYGRDVGYQIERIELDETLEQVSATEARRRMVPSLHSNPRDAYPLRLGTRHIAGAGGIWVKQGPWPSTLFR